MCGRGVKTLKGGGANTWIGGVATDLGEGSLNTLCDIRFPGSSVSAHPFGSRM